MGKINHKIDPTQSTTCSMCSKRHEETETHLYRCPVRRVAIEDFYLEHTLQEFLEANHTCPKIAYTLLEALYSDLEDSRYPEFGKLHGSNEPSYRKLQQKQAYIGWSQLFQGRLVKDWGQLQEGFIEKNNATLKLDRRYYSGAIWARKLVTLLWKIIHAQWDHRNADRHGTTTAANHKIRHERLLQSITAQYAEAPNMLAADRAIFEQPIGQKLLQHPNRLELWVKRTKPIVKLSKHDAEATTRRTHSQLTKYF
jgi:hypothetical protein